MNKELRRKKNLKVYHSNEKETTTICLYLLRDKRETAIIPLQGKFY